MQSESNNNKAQQAYDAPWLWVSKNLPAPDGGGVRGVGFVVLGMCEWRCDINIKEVLITGDCIVGFVVFGYG